MNRRSRTRFKTDLSVIVTCPDLPDQAAKGRLADLSVHGLSLILKDELKVGTLLRVEWGNTDFTGELIYCRPHGQEFLIGLRVEDSVYETARQYVYQ